jgi:hypothetical protein
MHSEKAVAFGPKQTLIGILTAPRAPSEESLPGVVFLNSGVVHRVGVNRLHVDLARSFASVGFTSLRFDLSGIGDSGRSESATSIVESVVQDIQAATDALRTPHGLDRFVLMGLCSGAYDALRVGPLLDDVVGMALIDLPGSFRNWQHVVHHYARRLWHWNSWKNALWGDRSLLNRLRADGSQTRPEPAHQGVRPTLSKEEMTEAFASVVSKGIALRMIFTAGVEDHYNHDSQFAEVFPDLVAHPLVSHQFLSGADHLVSPFPERDRLRIGMEEWLATSFQPTGVPG